MNRIMDWIVDILEKSGIRRKEKGFRYKTTITQDLRRIVVMCEPKDSYLGVDIASLEYVDPKKEKSVNFPFIQTHVKTLLKFMEHYQDDIRYHYIFIKYEDSIHTAYNALREYHHLNKSIELESEIMKKAHTIFNSLKSALEEREEEVANLEKEKDKASNESYLERLDREIEYIEKYVE